MLKADLSKPCHEHAHAKLNLYLHITGKQEDGYHNLESFFTFLELSDFLTLTPHKEYQLKITGPFSTVLSDDNDNIVTKTVRAYQKRADLPFTFRVKLEKNIPLGSGLGGGSADAGAVLRLLQKITPTPLATQELSELAFSLGADVPACLQQKSSFVGGMGEQINPLQIPHLPILLIYPYKSSSTADVYKNFTGYFSRHNTPPNSFEKPEDIIAYLHDKRNDLTSAALQTAPEISEILNILSDQSACVLARMTGSGSTCFGIFCDEMQAERTAAQLRANHTEWWIQTTHTL